MRLIDKKYIEAAQASQKTYGVPASVTLAQAILESGWFQHDLNCFNFFGIKWSESSGYGFVTRDTREVINGKSIYVKAKFVAFPSIEAAFEYHAKFLAEHPQLKRAMRFKDEPLEFIKELESNRYNPQDHIKYATDPNYVHLLTSIVLSNRLMDYDLKDNG